MTTFDERLDLSRDRADHLHDVLGTLVRTRAPMRTVEEVRVALTGIEPAEVERLNASLIEQVPQRRVGHEETVLVLAAVARTLPMDVVVETEPGDLELLAALSVGFDGVWSNRAPVGEPDGRAVRRMRFGSRADEGAQVRLCAVQLRLTVPGSLRLTRLAIEPAA